MTDDVQKKLDEITQFAKNFDNHHVSTQWDNWKMRNLIKVKI